MKITQATQSQMHIDIPSRMVDGIGLIIGLIVAWGWAINSSRSMDWQDLQHTSTIALLIFFGSLTLAITSMVSLVRHRTTEACTFDQERGLVLLQQRSLWGARSEAQYALKDIRDITIKRYSGEDSDSFRILLDLGKLSPPIALSGFASEKEALSSQVEVLREFLSLPQKLTYK
jgi:hypothetical protein